MAWTNPMCVWVYTANLYLHFQPPPLRNFTWPLRTRGIAHQTTFAWIYDAVHAEIVKWRRCQHIAWCFVCSPGFGLNWNDPGSHVVMSLSVETCQIGSICKLYANFLYLKNQYKSHLFGLIDQNVCCIFWLFRRAAMAPPNGRRWVKMGQRFFALPLTGKHWGTQNFDVALGCQKLVPFTTPGIHLAISIAHGTTQLRAMLKKRPKTLSVLNLGPMLNDIETTIESTMRLDLLNAWLNVESLIISRLIQGIEVAQIPRKNS